MVEIETIRAEFAKRLHKACNLAEVRERGRAVDIQQELKRRGVTASTTAIGKWLNGESIPEPDKLMPLADWLRVRPEWLEYGRGARSIADGANVGETGGTYRLPSGMFPMMPAGMGALTAAAIGSVASMVAAAPRAGAGSQVDADMPEKSLESLVGGMPLMVRVRRLRATMTAVDQEKTEEFAQKAIGEIRHADQVLVLLDAVLEAALLQAIDLEEIQAITTLVQKRRNEKVHGVNRGSKERQNDPR